MNKKKIITSSILISMLLTNKAKAEDLGLTHITNFINPLSNGLVTCSTSSDYDFWNDFLSYAEPKNEKTNGLNKADNAVISYFDSIQNKISEYKVNLDYNSLKSKAKELIITGIDFLFYDGTIKGYTRKDLTEKGKEHIMNYIASTLEDLETIYPGITDIILNKYGTAKDYLKEKFSSILGYLKDWVGEDYYNMFGNEFSEFKEDLGDLGDILGSFLDYKYQEWKLK